MQEGLWIPPGKSLAWGSIVWGRWGGGGGCGGSPFHPRPYRQKILKEKAVPMIEGYMFEEHEMIRRAATECMCNLAMSKEVRAGPGSPDGQACRSTCVPPGFAPADSVPSPLLAAGAGPV